MHQIIKRQYFSKDFHIFMHISLLHVKFLSLCDLVVSLLSHKVALIGWGKKRQLGLLSFPFSKVCSSKGLSVHCFCLLDKQFSL